MGTTRRSHHYHHGDGSNIDRSTFSTMSLCYCLVSVCRLIVVVSASSTAPSRTSFVRTATSPTAFLTTDSSTVSQILLQQLRGGDADAATEIEFESSDEEEDEESDDEEEQEEASLAKSAKAATAKVQAKAQEAAVSAAKSSLKTALQAKKAQAKKQSSSRDDAGGITSLFTIPYIIKATLNPVTFMKMTKLYWSSLFNHNYLKEKTVRG